MSDSTICRCGTVAAWLESPTIPAKVWRGRAVIIVQPSGEPGNKPILLVLKFCPSCGEVLRAQGAAPVTEREVLSTKLRCSFCGYVQDGSRRIIAGDRAMICDSCAKAASSLPP